MPMQTKSTLCFMTSYPMTSHPERDHYLQAAVQRTPPVPGSATGYYRGCGGGKPGPEAKITCQP